MYISPNQRCWGERNCPFPGPLCLTHFRQIMEPKIFEGWYSPTKQVEDYLVKMFGVDRNFVKGAVLPTFNA